MFILSLIVGNVIVTFLKSRKIQINFQFYNGLYGKYPIFTHFVREIVVAKFPEGASPLFGKFIINWYKVLYN